MIANNLIDTFDCFVYQIHKVSVQFLHVFHLPTSFFKFLRVMLRPESKVNGKPATAVSLN